MAVQVVSQKLCTPPLANQFDPKGAVLQQIKDIDM
jgi:hypothetical protein